MKLWITTLFAVPFSEVRTLNMLAVQALQAELSCVMRAGAA